MSQVKKIIVDSRYFVNNAPAGKGTFELAEIVEIHGSQVLYLESLSMREFLVYGRRLEL